MTKFTTLDNKTISAMTGPQLLALFNEAAELVGAPICKRFASLASGFTRTVKMVEQARAHEAANPKAAQVPAMNSLKVTAAAVAEKVAKDPKSMIEKAKAPKGAKVWEKTKDGTCPKCNADPSSITPAGLEGTAAEHRNFCHVCNLEWDPESGKEYKRPANNPGVRAAAAAKTWADPAVAAKRIERTNVRVTGGNLKGVGDYKSVAEAFKALNLPMSKHIKFRMAMKAAGAAQIGDYFFTAHPAPKAEKAPKKEKALKITTK